MRRVASALPFDYSQPFFSAGALHAAGAIDDFVLYTALAQARSAALGINTNYLQSWPFNIALVDNASTAIGLTDQRLNLVPQLVPAGEAIDGVAWVQTVTGNYTPNNNNRVGAYTFDGVNMTRVAQSNNGPAIWAAAAGFTVQVFNAQLAAFAVDTVVWAAALYCRSAVVTQPQIAGLQSEGSGAKNLGLGTYAFQVDVNAQTALPATIPAASLDQSNTNREWLAFYRAHT